MNYWKNGGNVFSCVRRTPEHVTTKAKLNDENTLKTSTISQSSLWGRRLSCHVALNAWRHDFCQNSGKWDPFCFLSWAFHFVVLYVQLTRPNSQKRVCHRGPTHFGVFCVLRGARLRAHRCCELTVQHVVLLFLG